MLEPGQALPDQLIPLSSFSEKKLLSKPLEFLCQCHVICFQVSMQHVLHNSKVQSITMIMHAVARMVKKEVVTCIAYSLCSGCITLCVCLCTGLSGPCAAGELHPWPLLPSTLPLQAL